MGPRLSPVTAVGLHRRPHRRRPAASRCARRHKVDHPQQLALAWYCCLARFPAIGSSTAATATRAWCARSRQVRPRARHVAAGRAGTRRARRRAGPPARCQLCAAGPAHLRVHRLPGASATSSPGVRTPTAAAAGPHSLTRPRCHPLPPSRGRPLLQLRNNDDSREGRERMALKMEATGFDVGRRFAERCVLTRVAGC
jgi:hypothetical protein